MAAAWMWGWELGLDNLTYGNTGWAVVNTASVDAADTNPYQPAAGYGGGRFNLRVANQNYTFSVGRIQTPTSGTNSIGTHSAFVFHDAYKRAGGTGNTGVENGALLQFYSGITETIRLVQVGSVVDISAMALYVNGNLQGTTTTTFTGSQPYHRIVLDMDGINGDYDVYVNGVLEISVTGSSDTFASIDSVEFLPGATANLATGGGYHDHAVLFGNPATDLALALGDIYIQGLLPDADSVDGSWLNVGGVNDGTNTDMYANINDGSNLTDFIETLTTPDANEFDHEGRADIDPSWAPSQVHYVQSLQVARASGAISQGRITIDNPTMVKHTSANKPLVAAGKIQNELIAWTGNATTDLDGLKTGIEV